MVPTQVSQYLRVTCHPGALAYGASALAGVLAALLAWNALYGGLTTRVKEPPALKPTPVKVGVRAQKPSTVSPDRVLLVPVTSPVAEKIQTTKPLPKNTDAPPVLDSTEKFDTSSVASVGSLPSAETPPLADLPPIPSQNIEVPQLSEFTRSFNDTPGGDIVVLGLLLNDEGVVIDSKILLPSGYVLGDLTVALASVGQKWSSLVPPLLPGEVRWIEQRIDQRTLSDPAVSRIP